jgi:hypothetical protein
MTTTTTPERTVHVLTTSRVVNLPFTVTLVDFDVASASFLKSLDQDSDDDPDSEQALRDLAMVEHVRNVWQAVLGDERLFQWYVRANFAGDGGHENSRKVLLAAAQRVGEETRQFFEGEQYWECTELLDKLVANCVFMTTETGGAL